MAGVTTMEKYDIIIQAGQSNADGTAKDKIEKLYVPDPRILYLEAEKTWANSPDGVIVNYADKPFDISVAEDKVMYFKKSNVEDLADKLKLLCDDGALVEKLRDGADEFILNKYSWQDVAKATCELYQK